MRPLKEFLDPPETGSTREVPTSMTYLKNYAKCVEDIVSQGKRLNGDFIADLGGGFGDRSHHLTEGLCPQFITRPHALEPAKRKSKQEVPHLWT